MSIIDEFSEIDLLSVLDGTDSIPPDGDGVVGTSERGNGSVEGIVKTC
jgi:hypothetical protein